MSVVPAICTTEVPMAADVRGIYVFMAVLFAAVTLIGFQPTTSAFIAAVAAGDRPPPSLALYLHAASMAGWFLVLPVQSMLVVTGQRAVHRTLGLVSVVLAPVIVAGMAMVVTEFWDRIAQAVVAYPAIAADAKRGLANFLCLQIADGMLFAVFVAWALGTRRRDLDTHKRMMILATFALVNAAIGRMRWLPGYDFPDDAFAPVSFGPAHLYHLLLLVPVLVHDVIRRGRPHRAYLAGLALIIPVMLGTHLLWDHPWWLAAAPWLIGAPDALR
jgi:hypothetical protein